MTLSAGSRTGPLPAGEREQVGIDVVVGSAVVVVAALVSAAVPQSAGSVRLGLFAAALGLFAAMTADAAAVVLVGLLGFGIFDGFLVNQLGVLSWHGTADVSRLCVLLAAAACGLAAGGGYRVVRRAPGAAGLELNNSQNVEATKDA